MDPPAGLPDRFVVLLGGVSARKRQHATVLALAGAGGPAPVVIGGFEGSDRDREAFAAAVDRAGGVWLGELGDQAHGPGGASRRDRSGRI